MSYLSVSQSFNAEHVRSGHIGLIKIKERSH